MKEKSEELIYASQSHYGSWWYYDCEDFGTHKFFIEVTESGADYWRVRVPQLQNPVGRVGVLPLIFKY